MLNQVKGQIAQGRNQDLRVFSLVQGQIAQGQIQGQIVQGQGQGQIVPSPEQARCDLRRVPRIPGVVWTRTKMSYGDPRAEGVPRDRGSDLPSTKPFHQSDPSVTRKINEIH